MAKARQVASLFGTLRMQDDQFKKSLADGRSGVLDLGSRVKDVGRDVTDFGMKMTGAGMAILTPLGLGVKAAVDFEYAFSGVVKTVTATDDELAVLNSTIRDMASNKDNPLSSLENAHATLAQIMESGGQLGVATKDLVAFTETIGALSVATNLTAEQGATQMAQVANIIKLSADDFDNFAGALVRVGNNGASTEADVMALTSRIASAGHRAGFTASEILGFSNAIASMGISAELGGTNFGKFINTITTGVATGGTHLDIFSEVAGQSAADFKKSFEDDATGAVTTFLQGLNKLDPAQQMQVLDDLGLTGEEVARIVLQLAGNTDMLTKSLDDAAAGWTDANDHMKEAEAKAATTQGVMNRLQNQLTDLGVEVGNALLPAFNDILELISPIITDVSQWIAQNPKLVMAVAVAGVALAGLGSVLGVVGMAITAVGTVLGFLLSPIGLVAAAVAGLFIAFETNFMGIRDFIQPILDQIGIGLGSLGEGLGQFISDIQQYGLLEAILAAFGLSTSGNPAGGDSWVEGVLVAFGMARDAAHSAVETIGSVLGSMIGFVQTVVLPGLQQLGNWFINDVLPQVVSFVTGTVIPAVQGFFNFLGEVWAVVGPSLISLGNWFLSEALPAIVNFVTGTVLPAVQGFFDFLGGVWTAVQPALQSLYDWFVTDGLPAIRDFVINQIVPPVESFFNFLGGVWDLVSSPFNALVNWFTVEGLPQIREFIVTQVLPKINEFISTLQGIWAAVQPFLEQLRSNFETVFNGIKQIIQPVIDLINSIAGAVQDAIEWIQKLDDQPKVGIETVDPGTGVTDPGSLFGTPPQFDSGGWTGNGAPNQPAGIVHGQEWVVPQQGALVLRESDEGAGGMHFAAGAIVVNANTYEGGQAAARGFKEELEKQKRSRG
jgi:TP901 family phage tail tape measure protein